MKLSVALIATCLLPFTAQAVTKINIKNATPKTWPITLWYKVKSTNSSGKEGPPVLKPCPHNKLMSIGPGTLENPAIKNITVSQLCGSAKNLAIVSITGDMPQQVCTSQDPYTDGCVDTIYQDNPNTCQISMVQQQPVVKYQLSCNLIFWSKYKKTSDTAAG